MSPNPSPRRHSLRLKGYDYSQAGAYFITVCTQKRAPLFGHVIETDVCLNEIGSIVKQSWADLPNHYSGMELDSFVVMSNHVHGIVILSDEPDRRHGIPEIVRGFKTFSARTANGHRRANAALWQRGYYEHVIRDERGLNRIRTYISNNPARWADDPDNIWRAGIAERGRV
jgi:REP element-mobilizing transposase RayT